MADVRRPSDSRLQEAEPQKPVAKSPLSRGLLDGWTGGDAAFSFPGGQLEEKPFCSHLILRSRDSQALDHALKKVTGFSLPVQSNTTRTWEGSRLIWLSPSEWLLVTDSAVPAPNGGWVDELPAYVIDVSSGQTVVRLSGRNARELLSAGCMLDLHPRAFPVHGAAQSVIAKAGVTLVLVNDAPCFEIVVRRSYAPYLWRWLCQATNGLT